MSIRPSLHCPCGEDGDTGAGFAYEAAPEGETRFPLKQAYKRRYRVCPLCGHWFGEHALDLSVLYDKEYVDSTYGGPDGMAARFRKIMALPPDQSDNHQRVERVCAFARELGLRSAPAPRLLDVGAGLGVFPAAMARQGWQAVGLEPDPRTVTHLRETARVEAMAEKIGDLSPGVTGRFQAISFNKVLEHVEDPVAMLRAAAPLLADDGFVYIEMPDVAAAAEGMGREEFFIEHHHVFSPASLAMVIDRGRFVLARLVRVREPSGKFTLCAFALPR